MIAFSVFTQVLLLMLVVVGSGYLLQRRVKLDIRSVNRLSLYLLNPALIFASLVRSRIGTTESLRIGAYMVLFVLCIGIVTWLLSRVLRFDTVDTAALTLNVMWTRVASYHPWQPEGMDRVLVYKDEPPVQAVLKRGSTTPMARTR